MKIVNKKLSLKEFKEYVAKKDFGSKPPTFIVIHHTWKPTEKDWKGQLTISALKGYYEAKGWSAGPHIFIAPDGIWLFTDMYDVGIHAGDGNGSLKDGYSIGIEVVGDYDGAKWSGKIKELSFGVIDILTKRLNIPYTKIMFHRDFSNKTCPGKAITKEWIIEKLYKMNEPEIMNIPVIKPDSIEDYLEKDLPEKPIEDVKQEIVDVISSEVKTTFIEKLIYLILRIFRFK